MAEYWQKRIHEDATSFTTDAATYVKDLPSTGVLDGLRIRINKTTGTTATCARGLIEDEIDRIEVIANGSEIIFSMPGPELKASAFATQKVTDVDLNLFQASSTCKQHFNIWFGRWPHDKEFALDLSKYTNVQLKITYSFDIAVATWATGSTGIFVAGDYLIGSSTTPKGFFNRELLETWTGQTSGHRYVNLPVGMHNISRIQIRAYATEYAQPALMANAKLTVNSGRETIFDHDLRYLQDFNVSEHALRSTYGYYMYGNGDEVTGVLANGRIDMPFRAVACNATTGAFIGFVYSTYTELTCESYLHDGADQVANVSVQVFGIGYESTAFLFFGEKPWDPEMFLDAKTYGDLTLDIHEGTVASTVSSVCVDQVMYY